VTSRRIALLVLLGAALLAGDGCARRKIEAVQKLSATTDGPTLKQTYDNVLVAPRWEYLKEQVTDPATPEKKKEKLVVVSGQLAGNNADFRARYVPDTQPPQLQSFVVGGQTHAPDELELFLSKYALLVSMHRVLDSPAAAPPAGQTGSASDTTARP